MKSSWKRLFCSLALIATLAAPALAEPLYIRNRPFSGMVVGIGHDPAKLKIDVVTATPALGLHWLEVGGNYFVSSSTDKTMLPKVKGKGKLYVEGQEFAFTSEENHKLVNLKEFGDAIGARFSFSKDLAILDMNMVGGGPKTPAGLSWGGASAGYKLVFFGNAQAPACRHFKPILAQFERDSKIPVVWVDVNQPSSDLYRAYIPFFKGDKIPHTVLVDTQDKVFKRWTGSIPIGKFATEVNKIVKPR